MRKSTVVLLLIIVLTLTACKPTEEKYITYNNVAANTKEQLVTLIDQILLKTELLLPVEETPNILEVEYPFFKSDFTFVHSTKAKDLLFYSSGATLHASLSSIRDDLFSSTSYQENDWKEVFNLKDEKMYQYRIFMNNNEVILQHYKKNDENIIKGFHARISTENNQLEFIMNSIDYNYEKDAYENGQESYYKEDAIYYEKSLISKSDQHVEMSYMEYDFLEDNYKNVYLRNTDLFQLNEIEFFNSNDNYHVEYIEQTSSSPTMTITLYDDIGEQIYKTKKIQGYFTFDFNLKYVHGWDKITKVDSLNDLYTYSNEYRELPEGVFTIIRPEEGIFVSGNLLQNNLVSKFNLDNSGLYGPIDYSQFLIEEDNLEDQVDEMFFDTLENELADTEDFYDDILHYLYEVEFHGMCKDIEK